MEVNGAEQLKTYKLVSNHSNRAGASSNLKKFRPVKYGATKVAFYQVMLTVCMRNIQTNDANRLTAY